MAETVETLGTACSQAGVYVLGLAFRETLHAPPQPGDPGLTW